MRRIMFVCYGNICRSPMAEFLFRELVRREGFEHEIFVASSATSIEEIGNPVHWGTRKKLAEVGISCEGKYAVKLTRGDYEKYDYIIGMDSYNISHIRKIIGEDTEKKVYKLLDFVNGGDIADPWYTGNFEETYEDVLTGCNALMKRIKKEIMEDNK